MYLKSRDFAFAFLITVLGIFISKVLSQNIPLTGIDDAAISMSYAQNLANGHGYVYNVMGERVEGSTSFLWTCLLTLAFLFSNQPNVLILLMTATLTFIAVWSALGIARLCAEALDVSENTTVLYASVALLGAPGFFLWATWSQMEVGLWSALIIFFVNRLVLMLSIEGAKRGAMIGLLFAAFLLPLVRPEGVAVAVGLAVSGVLLSRSQWKSFGFAIGTSVLSFLALLAFRLSYFGQPWPNTFYAKVSADRVQTLTDGVKYVLTFVLEMPFAEVFAVLWILIPLWALITSWKTGKRFVPPALTVVGFFLTYAALGGDHFALWRFLEPIVPLLPIPAALVGAYLTTRLGSTVFVGTAAKASFALVAAILFVLPGWIHYHQERFDVIKEFRIAERGLGFGTALNAVSPQPVIGVGPAGGIAMSYDGKILDLFGLNWTEMAHANPIKEGFRNHASFDTDVFWQHQPDIVGEFKRQCVDESFTLWKEADDFKGLYWSNEFQLAYEPVLMRQDGNCWPMFAAKHWLKTAHGAEFQLITWEKVQLN